jgi:hypothetical protein
MALERQMRFGFVLLCWATTASASSWRVEDYLELEKQEVQRLLPQLLMNYPDARFTATQFSVASGTWRIIRVEDATFCEGKLCPTAVMHSGADWHALFLAAPGASVTHTSEAVNGSSATSKQEMAG